MEFSEWLNQKYVDWRGSRVGRGTSVADFARLFGASQQVMSTWMKSGSGTPNRAKYVTALIERYGDEARQVLGIEKPTKVEISLDQIPPELRSLLESAIAELNTAYAAEGISPDSPRAVELATAILGKHGFSVMVKTTDIPGNP